MELIKEKDLDIIFNYEEKKKDDSQNKNIIIEERENEEENIIESQNEEEENEITKIIKNIVLIISTPLSNDVYKIFKKYKFKNFYVQHTTVANSSFIADLNEQFYKNIIYQNDFTDITDIKLSINKTKIKEPSINDFFEDATGIYFNKNTEQFCCCFHDHEYNCPFLKNMNNELYINNDKDKENKINENNKEINNYDKKEGKIENQKDNSTHFKHLKYKCNCSKAENDFCSHGICHNNPENKKFICCCLSKNSEKKHNIKGIFLNNPLFEEKKNNKRNKIKKNNENSANKINEKADNKINNNKINDNKNNRIKLGYGINNFGQIKNIELIPDYEKMKFIVGRNKLVYDIYKKIFYLEPDKLYNKLINIFNKNRKYINLDEFVDIIIEYLKERTYLIYNEGDENLELNLKENENELDMRKYHTQELYFSNSSKNNSFKKKSWLSEKNLNKINDKYYYFEKINIKNEKELDDFKKLKKKENHIYFIIFNDGHLEKLENDFFNYYKNNYPTIVSIIVIFTKNISDNNNRNLPFEFLEFKNLTEEDYNIQYQREKIKYIKDKFETFIKEEVAENRDIKPIFTDNELNLKYEILFLFHCISSSIQEEELEMINIIKTNQKIKEKEKSEIKEIFGNFKNLLENTFQKIEKTLDNNTHLTKKNLKKMINEEITKISELFESNLMKKINII